MLISALLPSCGSQRNLSLRCGTFWSWRDRQDLDSSWCPFLPPFLISSLPPSFLAGLC